MLLPVATAMIAQAKDKSIAVPLLLGMAYAASIGGIGTPVGTPPNLVFMQVYSESFATDISFIQWMKVALPVVIIFDTGLRGFWLTRNFAG